ncbi:hypothetical protein SAMN05421594_4125 [Chryseobacterium oleae]|uniref:Uncharacterized protein n=1 Tax=Chryseobacterium oleae TaxID=491207 RepID=A0A1I5BQS3_CHROL|nr:hypothetical protein SAMN05421594_4125 [Chryseobacterium oleae]
MVSKKSLYVKTTSDSVFCAKILYNFIIKSVQR